MCIEETKGEDGGHKHDAKVEYIAVIFTCLQKRAPT
jgi:hypothetical protein